MTKNQGLLLGIAFILLFTCIALATSSATSDVIIYAFDQNPVGSDEGNEWVALHNPANESVDIGNWTFESTHGTTAIDWIAEGTTLYPGAYCTYTPNYRWLDNSEEAIILRNAKGEEVDRTPVVSDNETDNRYLTSSKMYYLAFPCKRSISFKPCEVTAPTKRTFRKAIFNSGKCAYWRMLVKKDVLLSTSLESAESSLAL